MGSPPLPIQIGELLAGVVAPLKGPGGLCLPLIGLAFLAQQDVLGFAF